MADLNRRLCRLEVSGGHNVCPECGIVPGAPVEYQVSWHDTEDAEPIAPEWCGTCGEQTVYVVGWADISPTGPGVG